MSTRDQLVEAIETFVTGYGLGSESFHASWRCDYPDIYGLCGCEVEFRDDVIDTLLPILAGVWDEGRDTGHEETYLNLVEGRDEFDAMETPNPYAPGDSE